MNGKHRSWALAVAAGAMSVVAIAAIHPTNAGALRETLSSGPRVASIASATTRDFRVAVVARRLTAGPPPTAEVRVGTAYRANGSWLETGEMRLRETYFWRTVTGPRAVCRLEIATASSRAPHVMVQLLLSPSLGCGRTYRIPLRAR
jgi:hypothetical protein